MEFQEKILRRKKNWLTLILQGIQLTSVIIGLGLVTYRDYDQELWYANIARVSHHFLALMVCYKNKLSAFFPCIESH